VGSYGRDLQKSKFSNYGPCVNFYGPGEGIIAADFVAESSENQSKETIVQSGTCMAAAHVVGIIAMMLEQSPRMDTREIIEALKRSSVNRIDFSSSEKKGYAPTTKERLSPCTNDSCVYKLVKLKGNSSLIIYEFQAIVTGTFQAFLYGTEKIWLKEKAASFDLDLIGYTDNGIERTVARSRREMYPQRLVVPVKAGRRYKLVIYGRHKDSTERYVNLWYQQPKECDRWRTCGGIPCNDVGDCSKESVYSDSFAWDSSSK
jgi:hypothetical protein